MNSGGNIVRLANVCYVTLGLRRSLLWILVYVSGEEGSLLRFAEVMFGQ
jgi:hypothetical protein